MKKWIPLFLICLNVSAQSGGTAGIQSYNDPNNQSTETGFGGALGGASSTTAPTNIPSNVFSRSNKFSPRIEPQRMEEREINPKDNFKSTKPFFERTAP